MGAVPASVWSGPFAPRNLVLTRVISSAKLLPVDDRVLRFVVRFRCRQPVGVTQQQRERQIMRTIMAGMRFEELIWVDPTVADPVPDESAITIQVTTMGRIAVAVPPSVIRYILGLPVPTPA